jgi:hypothetical protein
LGGVAGIAFICRSISAASHFGKIALGDVIQSARLILLDESNGIHPAKGSHQGFKSSRAQFDRLD